MECLSVVALLSLRMYFYHDYRILIWASGLKGLGVMFFCDVDLKVNGRRRSSK